VRTRWPWALFGALVLLVVVAVLLTDRCYVEEHRFLVLGAALGWFLAFVLSPKAIRVVLLLAALGVCLFYQRSEFTPSAEAGAISTLRRAAKSLIRLVGAPITLMVTITNDGQRSLFIGRDLPGIGSDGAQVTFLISDKHGRSPEGHAEAADRLGANLENLATAVLTNWLALPPGFSYSFPIDVRKEAPEFFGKKGLYKIQAVYHATGIRTQVASQRLQVSDEDIKRLPFAAWEGTAKSNEVWIQVVAPHGTH